MKGTVVFKLPDGTRARLHDGQLIGRGEAAALRIDDLGVSEAHAIVSNRTGGLRLMSLRGALAMGGTLCTEVVLKAGQRIAMAEGLEIEVEELTQPARGATLQDTAKSLHLNIHIESRPQVLRIRKQDGTLITIGGNAAHVVWLLSDSQASMHWRGIVSEVWPTERDPHKQRGNFDKMRGWLKNRLHQEDVREDLLVGWNGDYHLNLHPGDTLARTQE